MVHRKPSVLIVDDDKVICDLVCEQLAGEGYYCDVATNAEDAFAKIERHSYDVALLDIRLPGKSGIDILRDIRQSYDVTAIVIMSAIKDIETAVQAMRLGASDYIVKPFTLDKLKASMELALKKGNAQDLNGNTFSSVKDYTKDNNNRFFNEINAIANGVDARIDFLDSHSRVVTEKTIEMARWLGLPGDDIEKWAVTRDILYSERVRQIETSLSKLEQNLTPWLMLGLASPLILSKSCTEEQN